MRAIILSGQYKKDLKLAGNLSGFRECHIKPDWLLIYGKEDNGELHILNLVRTGTQSDLFKKCSRRPSGRFFVKNLRHHRGL